MGCLRGPQIKSIQPLTQQHHMVGGHEAHTLASQPKQLEGALKAGNQAAHPAAPRGWRTQG